MLKTRAKRQQLLSERAIKQMAQIEASIVALSDDDLLDLADIFRNQRLNPLAEKAFSEMSSRRITL